MLSAIQISSEYYEHATLWSISERGFSQFIREAVDILQMIAIIGRFAAHKSVVMIQDLVERQSIIVVVVGTRKQVIHFVARYLSGAHDNKIYQRYYIMINLRQ